jgi:dephospho-CoA kinase
VIELVVGISGEMLAGKTTVARFLEARGLAYTRISLVIDDVLRERGLPITRENQQTVGLELHQVKGQHWLCGRAIDRLYGSPSRIVVDGLRWPEDAEYFRQRFGDRFLHVDIFASNEARRQRALYEGRQSDFDRAEHHPVEDGVEAVGDLADVMILNDSDIASLEQKVYELLEGGAVDAS